MVNPRLTTFMISLIIVGVIIAGLSQFMGSLGNAYNVTYDEQRFAVYNEIQNISKITGEVSNSTLSVQEETSLLSVARSTFSSIFSAVKLVYKSIAVGIRLVHQAASDFIGLGSFGTVLVNALITIIIILLVIGVILRALMKGGEL
jgi:hypothetical protein